jgi:hypothetical protein
MAQSKDLHIGPEQGCRFYFMAQSRDVDNGSVQRCTFYFMVMSRDINNGLNQEYRLWTRTEIYILFYGPEQRCT